MKNIDKQLGRLLFERLFEVLSNEKFTESERIPKYRTILDDLFKALTADSNQYFSNLFARETYIFKEYQVPIDIVNSTRSLRIYANKVVHESGIKPQKIDDQRCVYQLSEGLSYFSNIPAPQKISDFYKPALKYIKSSFQIKKEKRPVYDFFAVVEDIYIPKDDNKGKFCILACNTENLGSIKLKLKNRKNESGFGSNLAMFGEMVDPFQTIYVTEVEQVKDKNDEFEATERSLLVLEPDYLIDAKELSECRQFSISNSYHYEDSPLLYLLGRFTKGQITESIIIGNIVGRILDDMVTEPKYEYRKTFESVMRENSFGLLCIANEEGNYDRTAIQKIYIEAQDHEKQIKNELKVFNDKQKTLEPSFISNKYGLQGRLDLLIEHGKENNRKDIIELKSSRKFPKPGLNLYPNHEAQTMCYDLLLKSAYPDRIGETSILYSKMSLEEKPLRNSAAGEKHLSIQDLLMLRNRIVENEIKLAGGDFKPFFDIMDDSFALFPVYLNASVTEFRSVVNNLEPLVKNYFLGYLRFIYKELLVAKLGDNDVFSSSKGYSDLWKASKAEKIENYNVLVSLKIKEINDDFHVLLEFDRDLFSNGTQLSSFRIGDTAILYPTPNQSELNPLKSQILKCQVLDVALDHIKVSLINKQVNNDYFQTSNFWALERDFRDAGYKQMLQLLYEFLKSEKRTKDLILGKLKPEFNQLVDIPVNNLDPVQYENVRKAISAKDYYLIQGPPGTGKTSKVLVEIVRNILSDNTSVMIVAFTNRAVDEICEKLTLLNIDCIRLGKGNKSYYWSEIASKGGLNDLYDTVKKRDVFVSTITTFINSLDILKLKQFDTLIIDESSQVLEPQVVGFLKYFRKWILIGDENQLPAVVLQNETSSQCKDEDLLKLSLSSFRESLFYRLKKNAINNVWNECYGTLKYQYRMHSEIAEFPKKYFYKNELEEGKDEQRAELTNHCKNNQDEINRVLTSSRLIFIPSNVDYRSKVNEEEARLTVSLIEHIADIYGNNFNPGKTVGVITPFRAQIVEIRNALRGKYKEITIDTVERFQGSERDIIILSYAIKSEAQLRIIKSVNEGGIDRKLNVAITRAKEQLIILGSEAILKKDGTFECLIDYIKSKGGYYLNPIKVETIPNNLY